MAFIGILTAKTLIQRVGLSNVPPDRLRPINPFLVGNIVLDRHLIVTGLAEHQQIVSQRGTAHTGILVLRHEHESLSLRANRLSLWILVHGDFAVENPTVLHVSADYITTEVGQSNHAVSGLRGHHLLHMHASDTARFRDPQQFADDVPVILDELFTGTIVAQVAG